MTWIKRFETSGLLILAVLFLADVYFWQLIFTVRPTTDPRDYVLAINGHKDALLIFQGGAKAMINAGVGDWARAASSAPFLASDDAYVDIAIIGNMNENRFSGFEAMLAHVNFGAFIFNGREPYSGAWLALRSAIDARHIPLITLGAGDRILYNGSEVDFLSPNHQFVKSPDPMDAGLSFFARTPSLRTIVVSDVGSNVEHYLATSIPGLSADVILRPAATAAPTSTLTIFQIKNGKLYNEVK